MHSYMENSKTYIPVCICQYYPSRFLGRNNSKVPIKCLELTFKDVASRDNERHIEPNKNKTDQRSDFKPRANTLKIQSSESDTLLKFRIIYLYFLRPWKKNYCNHPFPCFTCNVYEVLITKLL